MRSPTRFSIRRTSSLASGGPLVLFVDNSWAAAPDWERRIQTADALIDDAESAGTPVSIAFTADPSNDAVPGTAAAARDKLRAAEPRPLVPDRERAFQALRAALNGIKPGTLAFLTDGAAAKDRRRHGAQARRTPAQPICV